MNKLFGFFVIAMALAGCGNMVKNKNGSENLIRLGAEPINCQFLYKLEAEVSVYDAEDARRYLENKIADQARPGNAYWITSQRTRPNEGVVFGPERAFVLNANVYDCPNLQSIKTRVAASSPEHYVVGSKRMYGAM